MRGQSEGDDYVISDIDDFGDDRLEALAALVVPERRRPGRRGQVQANALDVPTGNDVLADVEDLAQVQGQLIVDRAKAKRRHPTAHRQTA